MKSAQKSLFAIMAVAIMFFGAMAVTFPAEESDAVFGPNEYYKYIIHYTGDKIDSVDVYTSSTGSPTNIDTSKNDIWNFDHDTGYGPFNSFYAAVDIHNGKTVLVLDPYDLSKTIGGGSYNKNNYNIVWMIPTVYWSVSGNSLILSNDSNEGTAYAHTIGDGNNKPVHDYIGIGVYYASTGTIDGKDSLMSQSGKTPTISTKLADFDTYAHNTPGSTMLMNFYQWTFMKMAAYMVGMGKNTQQIWGAGYSTSNPQTKTGYSDSLGPYYGSSTGAKVFVENPWGFRSQMLGDAMTSHGRLYAGQNANPTYDSPSDGRTELATLPNTYTTDQENKWSWITSTYKAASYWDLPATCSLTNNSSDTSVAGDNVLAWTGVKNIVSVGGRAGTGAGISLWNSTYVYNGTASTFSSRLAYYFDDLVTVTVETNKADYGQVNGASTALALVKEGESVTVSGHEISVGGSAVLTATPSPDCKFLGWRTTDRFLTTNFTINADMQLVSVFGPTDSYIYVMNYTGERIDSVDVFNGTYKHVNDAKNPIWDFKDGVGPFNSCYVAVDKTTGDPRLMLDPYHLDKTVNGGDYTMGDYNIVWFIPTVYWTVIGDSLVMSDVSTEGTAYAHTADGVVWKYIGIGVYEATTETIGSNTALMSQSGKTPTVDQTIGTFDGYGQNTPGDAILWNYYHWTFTKMATYMVGMGKNVQLIWGMGNTHNLTTSQTGLGDAAGPYVSFTTPDTTEYSKVFIENSWGSVYEWLGSTRFNNPELYVAQTTSGIGDYSTVGSATGVSVMGSGSGWISNSSKNPVAWDLPLSVSTDNHDNPNYPGDLFSSPGNNVRILSVGGCYSSENVWTVGIARIYNGVQNIPSHYDSTIGGRLAYFFNTGPTANITAVSNISEYGTVSPASIEIRLGSAAYVGDNTITVDGKTITATPATATAEHVYAFKEWNTQQDGHGTKISTGYRMTSEQTIYAIFTLVYNVAIESNNTEYGTVSEGYLTGIPYGSTFTVDGNILTINDKSVTATPKDIGIKNAFTFVGWFDALTGGNEIVTGYELRSEMNIYARFNASTLCKVTFDLSGKGDSFYRMYASGEPLGKVTAKASAYTLDGWYADPDLKKEFKATDSVRSNMTLYAKWSYSGHTSTEPVFVTVTGGEVTEQQVSEIISDMKRIRSQGLNPQVIFEADGKLSIPSELTSAMAENHAKLIYTDKNVRIVMTYATLAGLGTPADVVLSVKLDEKSGITFPPGKSGIVYDITLLVNGARYSTDFVSPLDVTIDLTGLGSFNNKSVEVFYVDGTRMDKMDSICDSGYVTFDPPHLSQYAIVYDSTALVTVDLNGGSLTSKGDGWTYAGGKYTKYFALGTSVGDIMNDLGTYSMPGAIAISASGSTATVESEGMQITVGWLSFMNLAIIMILIILAVLAIFIAVRRNPNKG